MISRIVSLSPAATDWLVAFRAASLICGVDQSHPEVVAPVLAGPEFDRKRVYSALQVCDAVPRQPENDLDADAFRRVAPELVIVDAVDEKWPADAAERFGSMAGHPVEVFPWQPRSLRDVFEHVLRLGRQIDRLSGAMKTLGDGELRLRASHARTGINRRAAPETLPGVIVLSGTDPWTVAGRWTSELVDRAAGNALLTESGVPAHEVTLEQIVESAPELILWLGDGEIGRIEGIRTESYPRVELLQRASPGLYDAIFEITSLVHDLREPGRTM